MKILIKEVVPCVCLNGEVFALDRNYFNHRSGRLLTIICLPKCFIYTNGSADVFFTVRMLKSGIYAITVSDFKTIRFPF